MSLPVNSYPPPVTHSDDEVLVRVEGVSKKFCRSLKKSLWYGVCDIASELNPFGRSTGQSYADKNLTTTEHRGRCEMEQSQVDPKGEGVGMSESKGTESTERAAGVNQRSDSAEFFEGHSQAGLQMDSEKLASIRSANDSRASGEQTGSDSESVLIRDISGKKSSSALDSGPSPLDSTHGLRAGEFFAVKDVSFELRRGECLGLIGHNGAGKTTLLKMLNGLIKPDSGSITMRGRVGALIALGAGFNPILTGRENIYINGSVLGLTKKEIDEKIDEIIDFADIREFIDMPVQNYSSGMTVRLGFSVATTLEPDILILDEVLAVGDAKFRAKCYNRIVSLRKKAAVIFVTHSMEQIARICDSTLLISKGQTTFHGGVAAGILCYEKLNELGYAQDPSFLTLGHPIIAFTINNLDSKFITGHPMQFCFEIETVAPLTDFRLRISFYGPSGSIVAEVNQSSLDHHIILKKGKNKMLMKLPVTPLRSANYRIGVNLIDQHGDLIIWSYKQFSVSLQGSELPGCTDCQIPVTHWEME